MNEHADRVLSLPSDEIARRLEREGLRWFRAGTGAGSGTSVGTGSGAGVGAGTGGTETERTGFRGADSRRFSVTVFDVEAADVRRIRFAQTGERIVEPFEPDDRLRKIVARAAARALYILGLDFGQVEVETVAGGRPAIAGLSAIMRPSAGEGEWRTKRVMADWNIRRSEEMLNGVDTKLGADPEFILLDAGGRVVPASRYLPPDGSAGSDSVVRRGVRLWPLVELRPEPASEPAEVVASLRRLMAAAARRMNGGPPLAWRAGAWAVRGLPLGGHVHLSGCALTGERLRALDNAVALPLRLLEPPGAAARRPRYGSLGDWRRQPHGGFEYRTPPSWLVSPRLAQGVLALAKIAAEHARELAGSRPLDDDAVRDAFYGQGANKLLHDAAFHIYEQLRRTAGYRKYAADVDFVFGAIREGHHWDESADIRPKWGIPVR